jgi:hypothetical protein
MHSQRLSCSPQTRQQTALAALWAMLTLCMPRLVSLRGTSIGMLDPDNVDVLLSLVPQCLAFPSDYVYRNHLLFAYVARSRASPPAPCRGEVLRLAFLLHYLPEIVAR